MLAAFKSIPLTFYSRQFYADLILRGKGIGLGLMFVFVLLNYAGPMLAWTPTLPKTQKSIVAFFEQLPDITVKDKKLSLDRSSPYAVDLKFENEEPFVLMFDTNYQITDVATLESYMKSKNIAVLATAEYLVVRKNNDKSGIEIHDYSNVDKKGVEIRHDQWTTIGQNVARYFPLIFVVALIPLYLLTLVGAFFKGLAAKLLSLFFKIEPDVASCMRLAVAASLPPATLGFFLAIVKSATGHHALPAQGFAGFVIWFGLVIFGLVCADKEAKGASGI